MTNHSLPTGPNGSEGDSERKQWGRKREQFDAVISTTRFNGAIENLINGTVEVRSLLAILDELNASNQRGRYMAEVLALKQEARRLATAPFDGRVADFIMEGSRRIPFLSDGLASQMAVTLASAADNPAYLETVNRAVSNLLLDVGRPLKTDTRNYLRALTDKIDATRRLHEARGHLATVPSVFPPASEPQAPATFPQATPVETPTPAEPATPADTPAKHADSTAMHAASPRAVEREAKLEHDPEPVVDRSRVVAVGDLSSGSEDDSSYEELEDDTAVRVPPKTSAERTLMMPGPVVTPQPVVAPQAEATGATVDVAAQAHSPSEDLASTDDLDAPQPALADATAGPEPTTGTRASLMPRHGGATGRPSKASPPRPAITSHGPIPVPSRRPAPRNAPTSKQQRAVAALGHAEQGLPATETTSAEGAPREQQRQPMPSEPPDSLRIPTRGIPVWLIVMAVSGVALAGIGVWRLMHASGQAEGGVAPAPSGSVSASAASASAASARSPKTPRATPPVTAAPPPVTAAPPPVTAAPPPPPPPQVAPTKPEPAQGAANPRVRTPARPSPAIVAPAPAAPVQPVPKHTTQVPRPEPAAPKTSTNASAAAKAKPPPAIVTEPPSAPATPKPSRTVDDILADILKIQNDPAVIESKAHEIARIVARSARPDAEHILRRLIPEEVLAGTETVDTRALEPVRRVVALLLKKVALDKDDNRAALAIDSLGEWAKLRKHGAAAKLTLDELAESPVILSRPKRLSALERVQSRLGISTEGE